MDLRESSGGDLTRLGNVLGKWFRHAQRLFHVLVGVAFLFLAVGGAAVSFQLWGNYRKVPSQGLWGFGMVASFTVLLIIFCLYSFAKARSIR